MRVWSGLPRPPDPEERLSRKGDRYWTGIGWRLVGGGGGGGAWVGQAGGYAGAKGVGAKEGKAVQGIVCPSSLPVYFSSPFFHTNIIIVLPPVKGQGGKGVVRSERDTAFPLASQPGRWGVMVCHPSLPPMSPVELCVKGGFLLSFPLLHRQGGG